jgi:hypothetical protein
MPTEKDLQATFYYCNQKRFELIAPNVYSDWSMGEMDLLCIRPSGYVDEIEIKLTSSDFKADFKKTVMLEGGPAYPGATWNKHIKTNKHECVEKGLTYSNRFSFLLPEEIVDKCDIPDYAGLYAGLYVYRCYPNGYSNVREVKRGKLLHKNKIDLEMKYQIGRKMNFRYWNKILK